jgi:VWFA-related protein
MSRALPLSRAVLLLALFALPLLAQPRYGEVVEVRLIEVEAVVTDRDGNPVHGLTADDFEIFEGRARQPITNFVEYRGAEATLTGSETREPAAAAATPPPTTPPPRTIILFIDSLPVRGRPRARTFDTLRGFVEGLRAEDRVGIVHWELFMNVGKTLVEPTTDRASALHVIDLMGRALSADKAPSTLEADAAFLSASDGDRGFDFDMEDFLEVGERFRTEEHRVRMRRKTAALQRLVHSIGEGPGRKVILFVSQDFALPALGQERLAILPLFEKVAREANARGVTFYAVRPHQPDGLPTAMQAESPGPLDAFELDQQLGGLSALADPTGGVIDFGPAGMENLGPQIANDLGSYYSFGYRARSNGTDRERNVRVKVKNPEWRVRARRSYVEKSDETAARDQLVAQLFAEEDGGDLMFTLSTGSAKTARRNRSLVPVDMKIPVNQLQYEIDGGKRVAKVKVFVVAGNGIAEVTSIREESLSIPAPPEGIDDPVFTYSFELLVDPKGSRVAVGLFDDRSGLAGFGGIDLRGGVTEVDGTRR